MNLVCGLAACWACGGVKPEATPSEKWTGTRIDSLHTAMPALLHEFRVPGVSVALISGSTVQWSAGYGQTGRPGSTVSPHTVFQVASLGKPVFAYLIDRIKAQRNWELHDPINVWSPNGAYRPERGKLSAEELLSHTSGLRYDAAHDRIVLDAAGRGEWSCSGAGYVLRQRALEAAEDRSLEELSDSVVFNPLGLRNMSFVAPQGEEHAVGHDRSGNPRTGLDWLEANAASSLYASALDYARFLISVADADGSDQGSWERLTQIRAA